MADVLFVTKDIAGMALLHPLAKALKGFGHKIRVIAEGQSIKMWEKDTDNDVVKAVGLETDTETLIGLVEASDLIVTSLGRPIRLEKMASILTRKWPNKKLVWHPDIWGGERRITEVKPDLLLVNDTRVPIASHVAGAIVAETGSCYLYGLNQADRGTAIARQQQSSARLAFLAGQGEYSLDFIHWLADSIKQSVLPWEVVASLHPKYKAESWAQKWNELLKTELAGLVTDRFEGVPPDHIATVANITVSAYSTVLAASTAFVGGAVSVSTTATRQGMLEGMGVERYPLAEVGLAYEAKTPRCLEDLLTDQRPAGSLIPKIDPVETALKAVVSLL